MVEKFVKVSLKFSLYIFATLVFASFLRIGLSLITFFFYTATKEESQKITNYVIAILLALASVCFAWSRALKENEKVSVNKIVKRAEIFLFCSLIYLISAALKFYYFNPQYACFTYFNSKYYLGTTFAFICGIEVIGYIVFSFNFIFTMKILLYRITGLKELE